MESNDIKLTDIQRILIGDVPVSFLLELIIRATVIFILLMIAMRSMGKRMSSLLSRNELATLVTLAAAIGVPLMAPDRGLLPGVIIALVLIALERLISGRASKDQSFEKFSQGNISALIIDGVIDVAVLESVNLPHERLFAQLRTLGVRQLGTVKRLYMEAGGAFTLIKNNSPIPGLAVFPSLDTSIKNCYELDEDKQVCDNCGKPKENDDHCSNCGKKKWVPAVKSVRF